MAAAVAAEAAAQDAFGGGGGTPVARRRSSQGGGQGSPTSSFSSPSPAPSRTSPAKAPVARQRLGTTRQTASCWEYGSVVLSAGDEEDVPCDIRVVSALFGDPENAACCRDITFEVQEMLADKMAVQGEAGCSLEVHATTRLWGDPARFHVKQLVVTYDQRWLSDYERIALEALESRVSAKAQEAEDLEELLTRLGAAFLGAAGGPAAGVQERCPSTPSANAVSLTEGEGPATPASSSSSALGAAPPTPSAPLGATSPRWRQLGFQCSNPRSDLRTGRLALEVLVYMAERYPMATWQMVREAQSDGIDYPFAVVSINVTQLLARFLGLASDGVGGVIGAAAPTWVVRRFARLLLAAGADAARPDPFGELQAAAMGHLHGGWRARKTADPRLTVMDFAPSLEQTLAAVHAFCLSAPLRDTAEFQDLVGFDLAAHAAGTEGTGADGDAASPRAGQMDQEDPSSPSRLRSVSGDEVSDILRTSALQAASAVSSRAGSFGMYLTGIIGDTAAAAVAAATTPQDRSRRNSER